MSRSKARSWFSWSSAAGLTLGLFFVVSASSAAAEPACASLKAELQKDPAVSGAFTVLRSDALYRFQQRPYVRLPVGVKLTLQAPAGVTEADLYRAAMCSLGDDDSSPLGVPGSKVRVARSGHTYTLYITAQERSAAREIQRRAAQLP